MTDADIAQWWSWALTAIGALGLWLAGRRSYWGWAIGIFVQALWLAYGLATRQWGFVAGVFVYGPVHVRNFLKWRREAATHAEQATQP